MLQAVLYRDIDFAVMANLHGQAHVAKIQAANTIFKSPFSLAQNTVHFSFSRKSKCIELYDEFNNAIQQLNLDEEKISQLLLETRKAYFQD